MSITPTGDITGALAAFRIEVGPQAGEDVPVLLPVVTIGRAGQNDIVVPDDSVSTTHARLEYLDGEWRLTDLDSKNGTFAEGTRLAPQVPTPVPFGATVRFGATRLVFRPVEAADPDAARSAFTPREREQTIRERRSGFRFPVWLLLLVLVLIALALLLFGLLGPEPVETPQPVEVTPAAVHPPPPFGIAPKPT
jgi:hypothetical protein